MGGGNHNGTKGVLKTGLKDRCRKSRASDSQVEQKYPSPVAAIRILNLRSSSLEFNAQIYRFRFQAETTKTLLVLVP